MADEVVPRKTRAYCGLMPQTDWPTSVARHLAAAVRRYRKLRKLSAQQLSERCGELGLEISRATLADLENGRRVTFTVPELLVLSRALDVAPVLLLFPLGIEGTAEIAPGLSLPTWDAVKWFSGEESEPIGMFFRHDMFVDEVLSAGPDERLEGPDGKVTQIRASMIEGLRSHRGWMRERGLQPPELPSELAYIEADAK